MRWEGGWHGRWEQWRVQCSKRHWQRVPVIHPFHIAGQHCTAHARRTSSASCRSHPPVRQSRQPHAPPQQRIHSIRRTTLHLPKCVAESVPISRCLPPLTLPSLPSLPSPSADVDTKPASRIRSAQALLSSPPLAASLPIGALLLLGTRPSPSPASDWLDIGLAFAPRRMASFRFSALTTLA